MRKKIIIGNWKMYKNYGETKSFINILTNKLNNKQITCDYGIAASFTNLAAINNNLPNFIKAAQNCSSELEGAFTGEVSVLMLKDLSVSYVIIGHSERRMYFGETNSLINKKMKTMTINSDLIPILCCGETLTEYESGKTLVVIKTQIVNALKDIPAKVVSKMVIAYEPVWAIGTGKNASSNTAQTVCQNIRNIIAEIYDDHTASKVRIQYGGSVNSTNIKEFLQQPDIDGALVGSSSLNPESFANLIF